MINSVLDFNKLNELSQSENLDELISDFLKESIGVRLSDLKDKLEISLKDNVAAIASEITTLAINGDYSLLLEDYNSIISFLSTEACKSENWQIAMISVHNTSLLKFLFTNKIVDDGNSIKGVVFVNKDGGIKHSFAFYEGL